LEQAPDIPQPIAPSFEYFQLVVQPFDKAAGLMADEIIGDQTRTQANIAKASRLLDYQPSTTPLEGLVQTVAWYREQLR
jgi:nucleoside-diphosphate-sugar epimerase